MVTVRVFLRVSCMESKEHGGLTEVEALRAKGDTAYLSLHYADSTREEIVVPMMERNNTWYMR